MVTLATQRATPVTIFNFKQKVPWMILIDFHDKAIGQKNDKILSTLSKYISQDPKDVDGEELIECQWSMIVMRTHT